MIPSPELTEHGAENVWNDAGGVEAVEVEVPEGEVVPDPQRQEGSLVHAQRSTAEV